MRRFILCTEFRSGSTLFRRLFRHFLKENLDHIRMFEKLGINNNYFVYADNIRNPKFNNYLSLMAEAHTDLGIVFLSRRDKLAQALSIARIFTFKERDNDAEKINTLIEEKKEAKEVIADWHNFSESLLEDCILTAVWQYAYFKDFISTLNKDVLPVTYEDDLENPDIWDHTIKKVLDFIRCDEYKIEDIRQELLILSETTKIPSRSSGHLTDKKYKEFLLNFDKDMFP